MLHHGIATRLASGPASDACPNRTTVSGSRPSVATPCADRKSPTMRLPASGRHQASHATPAKLSQKPAVSAARSEEHTSELQSLMRISYAVFCLKKKTKK